MQIKFNASAEIMEALNRLGRTEDLKMSPSNKRLAIAGFAEDKILVIEVTISTTASKKKIALTDHLEITSPSLHKPHGLFFIDDETLIVTNREGEAPIFKLPSVWPKDNKAVLPAFQTIRGDKEHRLHSPGSVTVLRREERLYDVFICNNYAHYVTRHVLDENKDFYVIDNEILLRSGLDIPDGIALNNTGQWIAVSNHDGHCVYLYENTPRLNRFSEPDGILGNLNYPHGVRFTPDDCFILVADAGAPYVHIYAKNGESWRGIRDPVVSFRVMDETTYLKGRHNPQEGGPKGIDIDNNMQVLVTTCSNQILAFFDLTNVLNLNYQEAPGDRADFGGIISSGFPWA